MGYMRAEEILPKEIIELIQQYIDGENIYIPKKADARQAWGSKTAIRHELSVRNQEIYENYRAGIRVKELAGMYYLSEKRIQSIIRTMKV